jgi:hypothetical protein
MIKDWVDWEEYLVRSELGSALPMATLDKFRDHLNYYLMLQANGLLANLGLLEVSTMSNVDWHGLITDPQFSKGGKFDSKLAVDWFRGELGEQVGKIAAEEESRRNFEKNMGKALHAVYDQAGKDILPRPVLIEYALRELKVGIAQHDEAYQKLADYIMIGGEDETFGTILGPSGGTVRCKDAKGSPTATGKTQANNIHFGKVIRQGKKGSSPS